MQEIPEGLYKLKFNGVEEAIYRKLLAKEGQLKKVTKKFISFCSTIQTSTNPLEWYFLMITNHKPKFVR